MLSEHALTILNDRKRGGGPKIYQELISRFIIIPTMKKADLIEKLKVYDYTKEKKRRE